MELSKIVDKEEHWGVRCLKMLGYKDLFSRLKIEMNSIWDPVINK